MASWTTYKGITIPDTTPGDGGTNLTDDLKILADRTTGTTGSVIFVGSSTNSPLAEDNTHFFYDATNHRLGINNQATLSAALGIVPGAAADVGLSIKGASSQTGKLIVAQDSASTEMLALRPPKASGANALLTLTPFGGYTRGIEASYTLSAKPASNSACIDMSQTVTWTGSDSNGPRGIAGHVTDSRVINNAGGANPSVYCGLFSVNRSSSYDHQISLSGDAAVLYGLQGTASDSGKYSSTSASQTLVAAAAVSTMTASPTIDKTGQTMTYDASMTTGILTVSPTVTNGTLNINGSGLKVVVAGTPTNSGTLNSFIYGAQISGTAHNVGTNMAGAFYTSLGGSGTVWSYVNDTAKDNYLGGDNSKAYFGTGTNTLGSFTGAPGDAYIAYDGTNLVINPKSIGSGAVSMTGNAMVAGDLTLTTAGNGHYVKEGTNATMGLATLSSGSATVNTTKVTANSRIFLTIQDPNGGTIGTVYVSARTASTSFTITSTSGSDVSKVAWLIVEPAP